MGGDKRQPLEAGVPPVGEDPLRSSGRRRGSECRPVKPTVYDKGDGRCQALFQDEKPAL